MRNTCAENLSFALVISSINYFQAFFGFNPNRIEIHHLGLKLLEFTKFLNTNLPFRNWWIYTIEFDFSSYKYSLQNPERLWYRAS